MSTSGAAVSCASVCNSRIGVVRQPAKQGSEEALRAHCVRELGLYKTPKILRLIDDLPKGASGKV
jgi:long-chain acyl-CoA synthetase